MEGTGYLRDILERAYTQLSVHFDIEEREFYSFLLNDVQRYDSGLAEEYKDKFYELKERMKSEAVTH